jgi:DNA-binding response OmpR family regulator
MPELAINRRTILCVDSDVASGEMLETALPHHELVFARTGFEAIRAVNMRAFDAYLLEYWLPDWAGAALCREIRKIDPHGPVVFCTAAVRDTEKTRALRAGANAYLTKPIDAEALQSRLRSLMSVADVESLNARVAEERAIQDELRRRFQHAQDRAQAARELVAASIERTARAKALKAFIDARGSRAYFDKWWPQLFSNSHAALRDEEARRRAGS